MIPLNARLARLEARHAAPSCTCYQVRYPNTPEGPPLCRHGRPWQGTIRIVYHKMPLPTREGATP